MSWDFEKFIEKCVDRIDGDLAVEIGETTGESQFEKISNISQFSDSARVH